MAKNPKPKAKLRRVGKATTIDESRLKKFIDPRLVVAFSHDVRQHIFAVLNEEISSPVDVGKRLNVSSTYLNHHFEVLEENDLIELVKVERVRGAKKHYYRAKEILFFMPVDEKGFSDLSSILRATLKKMEQIKEESADRLASADSDAIPTMVAMMPPAPLLWRAPHRASVR
jgi:predicted ArsR family transcriptional regulator